MHVLLIALLLAAPAPDTPKVQRLAAYIVKRQPRAKVYALRLARSILREARRVKLDPAALASVSWVEARFDRKARGSAQERGAYQLMPSDCRLPASWARLQATGQTPGYPRSTWRKLAPEARTRALTDIRISTYLAADELAGVRAWCRRAGHRVRRWKVGDPLGKRWHRYEIDRLGHHQSGGSWPRRSYVCALRHAYRRIKRVLRGR